jgi:hypothetical protein
VRASHLLLSLLVLLAGCAQPTAPPPDLGPSPPAFVDPIEPYHDHTVAADHALWTPNMQKLSYLPLGEDGKPHRYIGEIATKGDLAFVAVEGGRAFAPDVSGFDVVDIKDPSQPKVIGRAKTAYSTAHDVKPSVQGPWIYQGSQYGTAPGPMALAEGPHALYNNGILTWDVRDPTNPRLIGFTPVDPSGCHMVSVGVVADVEYVFCAATLRGLEIFRATDVAGQRVLTAVGLWKPGDLNANVWPHDMTFQFDPLNGRPIMVVSHIDLGVYILDMAEPTAPKVLGSWGGQGATHWHGQIHSAIATRVGDRRIVIATPELYTNDTAAVFVLDATDPSKMHLAREWVNPGNHTAFHFTFTTHQIQAVDGRLYLSYNHAGLWVLDLAQMIAGEPGVLGYYLPHEQAFPVGTEGYFVPHVWDVVVHRGGILASDRETGLYILHFALDRLGPDGPSSFA